MEFLCRSLSSGAAALLKLTVFLFLIDCTKCGELSDKEFLDKYDQNIEAIACEAVQAKPDTMLVNLERYATYEELAQLAFWNYGTDFSKNKLEFSAELDWKRNLVDRIFQIFSSSCPDSAVPIGYLNIFRELAMIYLNSVEPKGSEHQSTWVSLQDVLDKCAGSLKPYLLQFKALKVVGIIVSKDNMTEVSSVLPPEERADINFETLDLVVDNLWFMFSHTFGRCYPLLPQPAILAPKFKALFVKDILRPLMNRWADPGPNQDFGPIVGNYDMHRAQRNMRFCVTASYLTNGITELQMVRPLKVGHVFEGSNSILNRKTGSAFG